MAIEIFNRYENKYLLDSATCAAVQARLAEHMMPDAHNRHGDRYAICNLYYDTADSHLIRTSLQKPPYKEKLRLRAYGVARAEDTVYVEIKKKVRGLVNKRRSAMPLGIAEEFLGTGTLPVITPEMNAQVVREAAYLLSHKSVRPAVYLAYERMAWFGTDAHDLRVSFDSHIVSRRHDLSLASPVSGTALLPPDTVLMEIKVAQSIPLWLAELLSEYQIYPTSFSKYGREYMGQLIQHPAPLVHPAPQRIEAFAALQHKKGAFQYA
ncbi:MAG: polyphosphate polymerase domain-containing protein [Oscillospiraceae bacterium]|jgi:hypothetical protein|nr:polyphosphate polymerase domain-containing protein [Oscillospiraceae bacterium]